MVTLCVQVFVGPVRSRMSTGLPVHVGGGFMVETATRCPVLASISARTEKLANGVPQADAAEWNRELIQSGLALQYPALLGAL